MRTKLLWIAAAAIMVLVFAYYRSQQSKVDLNVEPHAREVIEKAKRQR